jgi:tetrahydromethanopterin S-methyltransferase subunit B
LLIATAEKQKNVPTSMTELREQVDGLKHTVANLTAAVDSISVSIASVIAKRTTKHQGELAFEDTSYLDSLISFSEAFTEIPFDDMVDDTPVTAYKCVLDPTTLPLASFPMCSFFNSSQERINLPLAN